MSTRNIITAVIIILSVLMGLYTISSFYHRSGKTTLHIITTPSSATIEIDGIGTITPGTAYLAPGKYLVRAKKEGFQTNEANLDVTEKSMKIMLTLQPKEGNQAVKLSDKDAKLFDNYQFEALREEQRKIEQTDPIVKKLPLRNLIYTVGYRADPDREHGVIVEIDAAQGYRNGAVYAIEKEGFNPTQYNINFRQYANPFQEVKDE